MGLFYNLPFESDEEGHKHTQIAKGKYFMWFVILGGQENNVNVLIWSFKFMIMTEFHMG